MFSVGQVHADLCSYCITNNEDQSVTIENVQATDSYLIDSKSINAYMHSEIESILERKSILIDSDEDDDSIIAILGVNLAVSNP